MKDHLRRLCVFLIAIVTIVGCGLGGALGAQERADWTVDYCWQGAVFCVPGGETVLLTEVLCALGVPAEGGVLSASFSRPEVVRVASQGEDTTLTGLAPFDTQEVLTVLRADGTTLTLLVTDAQNEARADITEYYFSSNDEALGSVKLTDSRGNEKASTASDGFGSALNAAGTTSNLFAVPVVQGQARFVNWTNAGAVYTTRSAVSSSDALAEEAIRPNKTRADHTTNMFVANFVGPFERLIMLQTTEGGRLVALSDTGYMNGSEPYAVSTARVNEGIVVARADEGYRFARWIDEDYNVVTYDDVLNTNTQPTQEVTYTAVFEPITDAVIYYQTNTARGSVSRDSERAPIGGEGQGAVATAHEGYQFISWVDENGFTVSAMPEFVPTGDRIYEGAIYTALFEPASYDSYLMVGPDDPEHGYVISPDYENTVNQHLVTMYVKDDGTLPATVEAVAYEEYRFTQWLLNGVPLTRVIDGQPTPLGSTIPAGFNVGALLNEDSPWNTLIACYEVNPDIPTHTINYVVDSAQGAITNRQDTWIGSRSEGVQGSTATAKTGYAFGGWVEQMEDGSYRVAADSTTATFVPQGDQLHDATYRAVFRPTTGGWNGYNMNLADVDVKWDGVRDWVISSAAGAPMYYSSHRFTSFGETFTLDSHIPEAEGYYFVGWFDKDRPATANEKKVNGFYSVDARVYSRGDIASGKTLKFTFSGNSGSRYTLEALWAGIDANSMRVPYDGNEHTITFDKLIETGTLRDTPRYKTEIEKILSEDRFKINKFYYQILDENGDPVGERVESDHFTQTLPGNWNLRVTAEATLNGEPFVMTKDVYLIIYPAQVIINKIWVDWYDETGIRPEEENFTVDLYQDYVHVGASGASGIENTPEPQWQVEARDKWTKTYPLVLVRPAGYGDTDQTSGYYDYTATERVPPWYFKVSETRVVSEDRLTTTITFVNRIIQTHLRFIKLDEAGEPLSGAEFLLEMVKNANGEAPNTEITYSFTAGEEELMLYNGYYRLTEKKAPRGMAPLEQPVYFCILSTESEDVIYLTDDTFSPVDEVPGITLERDGTFVMSAINGEPKASAELTGRKVLKNAALEEGQFSFTIQACDENGAPLPGAPCITVVNDAEGVFSHTLTWTYQEYLDAEVNGQALFHYLVREQIPEGARDNTLDNIHYDDGRFIATFTLTLAEDGSLVAEGPAIRRWVSPDAGAQMGNAALL